MEVDFDGLRFGIANSYNDLTENIKEYITRNDDITQYPDSIYMLQIQESLATLRHYIWVLISIYDHKAGFVSLSDRINLVDLSSLDEDAA